MPRDLGIADRDTGTAGRVIAFFSSRLGCLGSLLVSAVLTALVILVLYR
jgi:hypothetical protein